MIGRSVARQAELAFILAHELGHIALGHLNDNEAVVDVDSVSKTKLGKDPEEVAADEFALELLTGSKLLAFDIDDPNFTARQLAEAVLAPSTAIHLDPAVLALCVGHATGRWRQAQGAAKLLEESVGASQDPSSSVNSVATDQLGLAEVETDAADFLRSVLRVD